PFRWRTGSSRRAVVLCIHGFTASPFETRPIAQACVERGIDAVALVLPAHGLADHAQATRELARVSYHDWFEACRCEWQRCRDSYDHVMVYGQSMGGALALMTAAECQADACAVTGVALIVPPYVRALGPALHWLNWNARKDMGKRTIYNPQYPFYNLPSVGQLRLVAKRGWRALRKLQCPLFVGHSRDDNFVPPRVVTQVARRRPAAEIHWYAGGHALTLDAQGQQLGADIAQFFDKNLPAS
ncbi:MAG: alpha/beta hydrolase, partial [Gemmataceae bacterium]